VTSKYIEEALGALDRMIGDPLGTAGARAELQRLRDCELILLATQHGEGGGRLAVAEVWGGEQDGQIFFGRFDDEGNIPPEGRLFYTRRAENGIPILTDEHRSILQAEVAGDAGHA